MERYFAIHKRGSSLWVEIKGGLLLFIAVSYILIVNAQLIAPAASIPIHSLLSSTAIVCGVSTLFLGIFANLPYALSPGLGLGAYFAFGLLESQHFDYGDALFVSFIAACLLLFASLIGVSESVIRIIPRAIQTATIVGIGLLLALIGLQNMGAIEQNPEEINQSMGSGGFRMQSLLRLGDVLKPNLLLSSVGLLLLALLFHRQARGGVLVCVAFITVIYWFISNSFPHALFSIPNLSPVLLSPSFSFRAFEIWPVCAAILSFISVCLIDTGGVIHAMGRMTSLREPDGHATSERAAFIVTALGSAFAALFGCPPVIIAVESAAAVKAGSRTGIAAITCSLLFFLSVFFAPLLSAVPPLATAPLLVLIGALLIGDCVNIDWHTPFTALPAFLTLILIPFSYSISAGILIGVLFYSLIYIISGRFLHDPPFVNWWYRTEKIESDNEGFPTDEEEEQFIDNVVFSPSSETIDRPPAARPNGEIIPPLGAPTTPSASGRWSAPYESSMPKSFDESFATKHDYGTINKSEIISASVDELP